MTMLSAVKRSLKLAIRQYQDRTSGQFAKFCHKDRGDIQFGYELAYCQEIKPSATLASKVHNLRLAGQRIGAFSLNAGEILSFWRAVGNPNHDFAVSRSIIKGKTVNEMGGGICQVSGLIYFMAIKAGLTILERHNHSLDLYDDSTRFAPLGSDATVVYGYKDLRVQNPFDFAIKFVVLVSDDEQTITVKLLSEQPVNERAIVFDKQEFGDYCEVKVTYADGTAINRSRYRYPPKEQGA